jgi:hypothetical protein
METNDLQTAVSRAEAKFGDEWYLLSPAERSDAIYTELRELDRKAAQRRRQPTRAGEGDEGETAANLARP